MQNLNADHFMLSLLDKDLDVISHCISNLVLLKLMIISLKKKMMIYKSLRNSCYCFISLLNLTTLLQYDTKIYFEF